MENATKALLIAASVLIVIVLIAVSLKMLAPASDTAEEVGKVSSALGVSTFNSQFEKYAGKQSAAEVRSLISIVLTTWRSDSKHKVKINALSGANFENHISGDSTSNISSILNYLQNGKTYDVSMALYDEGYVTTINIL